MTLLLKDPEAALDYSVDWAADYLIEDSIEASSWTVEPVEAGGLVIDSDRFEPGVAIVKVAGGRPGRIYRLTNRIVSAAGREDARSIMLRVEKR